MMSNTSKPIPLSSFKYKYFSIPMVRSNGDIIIAPEAHQQGRALYKYDNIHDKFLEWIQYPNEFESECNTACIDKENDIIYIPSESILLKIYLKSKTTQCIPVTFKFKGRSIDNDISQLFENNPRAIIINKQLNIFGCINKDKRACHVIYDDLIKQFRFKKIKRLYNNLTASFKGRICGHCMFYIKSQNKLLIMGGKNTHLIREYDISNNKWNLLNAVPPRYWTNTGHILTKDEKYMIFLGGYTTNIYIMSTENMDDGHKTCNVKCPESGAYRAFLVDNYKQTDIIINGYLRRCLGMNQVCGINQFPNELINLLFCFYRHKYVHIIEYGEYGGGRHYKISLNEIFSGISNGINK